MQRRAGAADSCASVMQNIHEGNYHRAGGLRLIVICRLSIVT